MVKYDRVNFLEHINKKAIFPITQKDEYTGDNLLHFCIFENKQSFIENSLHLFENEINVKNAKGNTPFHHACLKGNIDIVNLLFNQNRKLLSQRIRAQQVDFNIYNKAALLPIQLAIARGHYFVVHLLLC
jgi:ankyrin repeat protein